MYKDILLNKELSITKRILLLVQYLHYSKRSTKKWRKRHVNIFKKSFGEINHLSHGQLLEYNKYWKGFMTGVSTDTVELCYNISGEYDKRIIPEEIFQTDIELTLNSSKELSFLGNKSIYNKWFPPGLFPRDFFHKIDGQILDTNLRPVKLDDALYKIANQDYPVVIKPNVNSNGGKDIHFAGDRNEVIKILTQFRNTVIQEKIVQHPFFSDIYKDSINTVRVCLYRSVSDNKIHILNTSLRMGKDGSLDNVTAGGIVCSLDENGCLDSFAVDQYGRKYFHHPNSKFKFSGQLPCYEDLCQVSIEVGELIFNARIISLDMCFDHSGKWRVIEVNLGGQTIRFAQYAGKPFFGKFTDEVKTFCLNNHWTRLGS